jgi:hypothetical protein
MISVQDGGGEQGNAVGDGLDWESHLGDVRPAARAAGGSIRRSM